MIFKMLLMELTTLHSITIEMIIIGETLIYRAF